MHLGRSLVQAPALAALLGSPPGKSLHFISCLSPLCSACATVLMGLAMLIPPWALLTPVAAQAHVWSWLSSLPTSTQGCPLKLLPQAAMSLIKVMNS